MPDEQIHPCATERAAQTVAEHQEPQELVFYAGWFCPFVQRTWICLEEKRLPYQYKEVNPYKKEKHFLDINPKGLVPAVEYKGRALYESLVLCEFLEDAFPSSAHPMLPADPAERAYARIWIDHIAKACVSAFMRLVQFQEPDRQDAARDELYAALRAFAGQVKGPFFFGDEFSMVDAAIAPWIVRDHAIAEFRGYKRADVSAGWAQYAGVVETRDSIVKTTSAKEHYTEIYGRYLRNEAQSEVAKAIRSGRGLP
ncbi:glutathione-S-transferase [Hymenopellis radicata]|nr:glutathione-S-transferase [Hymenopellis radicata]